MRTWRRGLGSCFQVDWTKSGLIQDACDEALRLRRKVELNRTRDYNEYCQSIDTSHKLVVDAHKWS